MAISKLMTKENIGGKAANLAKIDPDMVPRYIVLPHKSPVTTASANPVVASFTGYSPSMNRFPKTSKAMMSYHVNNKLRYAVRSSAVAEDGKDKSFAGMFESKLNVRWNELHDAIIDVRSSVSSERLKSYGIDGDDLRMAVIVMNMVDAKWSGTLFTRDPVENQDRMVMEYEEGVGGVVDGERDTEISFFGTEKFYTNETNMPYFTVHRIWAEARRLEGVFGTPVDIEWAIDYAHKAWILQVRPIVQQIEKQEALC